RGETAHASVRNARGGGLTRRPSTNSAPAGAAGAGAEVDGVGAGAGPLPLGRTPRGGHGCPRGGPLPPGLARPRTNDFPAVPPSHLGLAEPQRNEPRRVARLHPHENRTLAILLRVFERAADIGRIGNLLAADLENDVAGLDALVGGNPVGIDLGNHNAFGA